MVVVFTAENKASEFSEGEIRSGSPIVDWLLGGFILPSVDEYAPNEYTNYGFSMEIPLAMQGQELGNSFQGIASETSGLVQFQFGSSPFSTVGVQWETVDSAPNLQVSLEEFYEALRGLVIEVNISGQPVATTKDEHELIYQPIEAIAGGSISPGFVGAWYCDKSHRVYILYYANILELAEQIDPRAEFQRYIDSMTCHEQAG